MQYIQRAMEKTLLRTSRTFPVLLLTGPRQVGKTTLFLQRYQPPLLIDEIQYAAELLVKQAPAEDLLSLKTDVGPGAVVCMAEDYLPVDRTNALVPVWMI